ncbi:hypothetical protein Pint_06863 [Pistacia integerrima]|uniref:Uncharacterized protein n=1 Tax=Pistacia integerrima TaxID=434235 RepID=A0ACC0XWV6_9ROSI|nr:hypothetical protein Pint_06863 [Pistacia integerrima]
MTMTTKVSSNLGGREYHAERPQQKKVDRVVNSKILTLGGNEVLEKMNLRKKRRDSNTGWREEASTKDVYGRQEAIKSCPINIEDFDAIICNSGSELYYLWRDTVADLDYEAHVEYKWPGENERSMVIRLARTEHGAQVDDIAENVDACGSRC